MRPSTLRLEIVNGCEKHPVKKRPIDPNYSAQRNQPGPSDKVPVMIVGYDDPDNTFDREAEVDHAFMESEAQITKTNAEVDNTMNAGVHQTEGSKEEEQPQAAMNIPENHYEQLREFDQIQVPPQEQSTKDLEQELKSGKKTVTGLNLEKKFEEKRKNSVNWKVLTLPQGQTATSQLKRAKFIPGASKPGLKGSRPAGEPVDK